MQIQPLLPLHAADIRLIHLEGIETGIATFETTPPHWEEWNKDHLPFGRFVALDNKDRVVGWAALSPISARVVYAGIAEISIYVKREQWGKGVGKQLLAALIQESEQNRIWTLQASIIASNTSSIALHQNAGFRTVGYREKLGHFNQTWHDVVLMEKRSKLFPI